MTGARSPVFVEPWAARAFRVAAIGFYVTAYVKLSLYLTILDESARMPVVTHPLLPAVLRSPTAVAIAYFAPLVAIPALFTRRRVLLVATASLFFASCLVLGWSIDAHNDATWITGAWASLWLLFVAVHGSASDPARSVQAIALAQLIVALCFLGGFTGKLTSGYLSGDVLRHIYLETKLSWPWPSLRAALDEDQAQALMRWFSRLTVAGEGALVLLPLVPVRLGAPVAVAVMVFMVLISTWALTSVLACLVGLLAAAWLLDVRRNSAPDADRATVPPF